MNFIRFFTDLFRKGGSRTTESEVYARPVTAMVHVAGDSVFFCRSNEEEVVARVTRLAAIHPEVELYVQGDDQVAFSAPFEWAKMAVPFADGEVEF